MLSDFSLKHNTHDKGCDLLEAGRPSGARTKNRTPNARSGPSIGHRQPRPPDLGASQNPKFNRHVVVVVVFTLKAVPVSTQYFLTSVLVQLTRTPSVVTG